MGGGGAWWEGEGPGGRGRGQVGGGEARWEGRGQVGGGGAWWEGSFLYTTHAHSLSVARAQVCTRIHICTHTQESLSSYCVSRKHLECTVSVGRWEGPQPPTRNLKPDIVCVTVFVHRYTYAHMHAHTHTHTYTASMHASQFVRSGRFSQARSHIVLCNLGVLEIMVRNIGNSLELLRK